MPKHFAKNGDEPFLAFTFQTIKLTDVPDLIPTTYRSKYEAINQSIVEKIKTMAEGDTFLFAPAKSDAKLGEKEIRNFLHAINNRLSHEQMNWRIAYSKKAKAFVVAPYKRYKLRKSQAPRPGPVEQSHQQAALVAKEEKAAPGFSQDENARIEKLLQLTKKHLGFSQADLQTENHSVKGRMTTDAKRAVCYVAKHGFGIRLSHLAKVLNLSTTMPHAYAAQANAKPQAKEYVAILSNALNGG